jgi:hypothetical protein
MITETQKRIKFDSEQCYLILKLCYKPVAGSSPGRGVFFSIYLIPPAALWPWGSTTPLTEMTTRNLPGGKKRPARKADNLAAICEPNV